MTEQFVTTDIQDGLARLTLSRPPLNVLNIAMIEQLEAAVDELAADESARVLVLGGEGKMLSAGVDVADHTVDKVGDMIPLFNRVCEKLAAFPVPTIAAVHGHALGGGCELVLCCDLAVMAEGAKIGQPEVQLAMFPPVAALRLPYLTGYRAAADVMLTGRAFSAQEAAQMGLVSAAVPADQLPAWVEEKTAAILKLSRVALLVSKRALNTGFKDWATSLSEMERLYLQELMSTADALEGLDSFMEKREPVWKHA